MHGLKARVRNGRLVVDEPTALPEGTELDLVVDDGGDELDHEEREQLHAALDASLDEVREGHVVPASEVLRGLRSRE